MFRRKRHVLALLCLMGTTLVLERSSSPQLAGRNLSSPKQIEEVLQISQQLGLHYRGDREDGQVQMRLLVSGAPIPWERVNRLVIGRNEQTDWADTVAVIQGWRAFPLVAHHMTSWGNFRLYGDAALIQRLTGQIEASSGERWAGIK
jgi:hypothetical protein